MRPISVFSLTRMADSKKIACFTGNCQLLAWLVGCLIISLCLLILCKINSTQFWKIRPKSFKRLIFHYFPKSLPYNNSSKNNLRQCKFMIIFLKCNRFHTFLIPLIGIINEYITQNHGTGNQKNMFTCYDPGSCDDTSMQGAAC